MSSQPRSAGCAPCGAMEGETPSLQKGQQAEPWKPRVGEGRPKYSLDELLARCDPDAEDDVDREWLDGGPVGRELI